MDDCRECLPISAAASMFVVDLLTPNSLLRNCVCTLSIGVASHLSWS